MLVLFVLFDEKTKEVSQSTLKKKNRRRKERIALPSFFLSFTAMALPCASPESRTAVLAARLSDERERGEVVEEVKVKKNGIEIKIRRRTDGRFEFPHHLFSLFRVSKLSQTRKTEPAPERRI